MVKVIKSYVVIFESSITFGLPIQTSIEKFISDYKQKKNYKFSYYIPHVVCLESQKHMQDEHLKIVRALNSNIKSLKETKMYKDSDFESLGGNFSLSQTEVNRFVKNKFRSLGIKILKTPTKKINWDKVVETAVKRELPFDQGEKEKGFKDMVIGQTVLQNIANLSKDTMVVFICNDSKLKEYVEKNTETVSNFKIYPSIVDFESALKLGEIVSGEKPIEDITKEAELAFFNETDLENSLYFKENVKEKIWQRYSNILSNPPPSTPGSFGWGGSMYSYNTHTHTGASRFDSNDNAWVPVGKPNYRVSPPLFIKRMNDRQYTWESTIVYKQVFEPRSGYSWGSNRSHVVNFKVIWISSFDNAGSIDKNKCEISDIKYVSTQSGYGGYLLGDTGTSGYSGASGYSGNLTSDGQGTVSVSGTDSYSWYKPRADDDQ